MKSIANLVPTPSPVTTEQRALVSRTSSNTQQSQELAATPTSGPRPPMDLPIGAQQHSHTGETPLMGLETPSNMDSANDPFAQKFSEAIEITEHIYAKPELPVGAAPPLLNANHSEVGSNASGCNTVFSGASRLSLGHEDNGSMLNGSMTMAGRVDAGHELYSSQRIKRDASEVSLSNNNSDNAINI